MKIFYRSLHAGFLLAAATFATLQVHAQLSNEEKEEIREHARETRAANIASGVQLPVTKDVIPLPAPIVVNFTERANWDLAHPKTDFTKRNVEDEAGENGYKFVPKTIGPNAKICPIPVARGAQGAGNDMKSTNSPAPILSFNGVMGDGSVIPPDINAAAGLTYVMETTNQTFGIYNKTNGALVSSVAINTFFNATGGNGYFDPHILYDAVHARFLCVIDGNTSTGHGGLFLAVSKTSDPTGSWYVYTVDDGVAEATLLDFPEMGYNENWVVLNANLFSSTVTAEIYIMDRASLYSGTQGTITHFSDANSFCISAVQTMDTTTLTEWLVQDANGDQGGTGYMQIGSITGTVAAPTYNSGYQLGVAQPWNENTVQAAQKGTTDLIDNDDTRVYASQYINGSMWFAHTVWLPATGTATYTGVDWWQVNPAGTGTVQQFGRLATAGTWNYYPNIYANANGDALLGYSTSSSSLYASAVYSFHAAADAVNTMETLYTYQAGISTFAPTGFGGTYRWGDYTGVSIDPTDNSFWVSGEWANNGNLWATQIAHVGSSVPVQLPPVADFQANVTTSCTGTIQFTDYSSNTPTSWLWTFGDGTTSTLQNPTHTYLTNGTFTVSLKATNAYGNNTLTNTAYITIDEPAGPVATGASHCAGTTFSLSANTTNPVKWYDSTGTLLSTSNPFITPVLSQTTTYYVRDSVISPTDSAGPLTNTTLGTGGYLTTSYGLNFNVLRAGVLESVYVNAQAAGSITITIANSSGTTVGSVTDNVVTGGQRVAVNLPLTVGTGYLITYSGTVELYRNNEGAVYPYTDASGIVSITGNNAGTVPAYYYWFYDWYLSEPNCNSQGTAVTATVTTGINTSNATTNGVACFGEANGSATISPSGGTPSYTFSWSNGQTTATLTNVIAGNYTVTVHDASGCSGTASESISQPNALNVSVTATNASCGSNSGSIVSSVSGGTSTYTYSWSNTATTTSISNLAANTYTLTVTDSHHCTVTTSAVISNSGSLAVSAIPSASNCSGGSTGGASVTTSGGTSPFTYSWSNGNTTASITGVNPATYRVTVTDHGGCSGTASVVISSNTAPTLSTSSTSLLCFNGSNGVASVSVTSGSSPYQYAWNNGSSSTSITGLVAGTYYVTVTDVNSCQTIDSATVTQPAPITIFVATIQPTCFGLSDGSASVSATGGTPGYTYSWSNTNTSTAINNLGQGNYSVSLTDANSCTSSATFNITNPVAVSATVVSDNDSCFGNSNGSIQITPAGGTAPYTYSWTNNSTAATLTGLIAGTYTVTITDVHSCSATTSATISQPTQIVVAPTTTDATGGQLNGTASIGNITGGTAPYVVSWSGGLTGSSITGLAAGTYTVTVTDHNGCEATASAVVNSVSGITSVNNDLTFTIYPNPAKTDVTVDAGSLDKETTLVLEDVLGQALITKNITTTTTLDLSPFSDGVYLIELRQGGKRAVKKFVINR